MVMEYLTQPHFKYLVALAAFYVRLTFEPAREVYETLEPLLADGRKLRRRMGREGGYRCSFLDEFVDELLTKERVCGTSLRQLPKRIVLEDLGQLEPRVSPLGEEVEDIDRSEDEEDGGEDEVREVGRSRSRRRRSSAESDVEMDGSERGVNGHDRGRRNGARSDSSDDG